MKLYKYIVAGLFGAVLLSSCTDLEEHPYTFLDPNSYYNNEDQLNSALNSVYTSYRKLSNDGGTFMRLEGCTDFGQPNREGNKNNINDINAWTSMPGNTRTRPTMPEPLPVYGQTP